MKENYQRVWAEVDLDAVCYNMEQMHGNIDPHTKMVGVIKTDGYGHGAIPIARELEKMIVSGGRIGSQIELAPADLCRAARAEFADITV